MVMNSLTSTSPEHKIVYLGPYLCDANKSVDYSIKAIEEKIKSVFSWAELSSQFWQKS